MIELATDDPYADLEELVARTKRFAMANSSFYIESELQDYGAGNTVKCIVRRQGGRGMNPTLYATFEVNGFRRGIREAAAIIEGRFKWPPQRRYERELRAVKKYFAPHV